MFKIQFKHHKQGQWQGRRILGGYTNYFDAVKRFNQLKTHAGHVCWRIASQNKTLIAYYPERNTSRKITKITCRF